MHRNGKVRDLDDLARVLDGHRAENRKIVHCHGVFDLMHIGHIRHMENAKRLGEVLVVTVTPDRFVNKGPGRPVFGEQLRAEALAALASVDYVAVNRWPTAVEAIRLLRPHLYVKGAEYGDAGKDRTGAISLEEEAVRSVGGSLAFTHDLTFSSSSLINRHLGVLSPEATAYLGDFSTRYAAGDVIRYLDDARKLKVLVVGEAIIDEYVFCQALGKSIKEPILALRSDSVEKFAGGSLAVANNVADFSDHVTLLTLLGDQNPQEEFIRERLNPAIDSRFLFRKRSPTIVKRRFVEGYFFQKMFEVYEINTGPLEEEDDRAMCAALAERIGEYDLVLVIDYGHGMLSANAIRVLCEGSRFLALNAQANAGNLGYHSIAKYARADYACMGEGELRLVERERFGDPKPLVLQLARKLQCGRMMITRGKYGALCYAGDTGFRELPALATQVVDRMGAGDAFLSVSALCVVQNAPMEIAAFVGSAAGAEAVATVGHRRSIERVPLLKHIEALLK
ncbi:MAG: adenylyltransferase/cytidyltransferase family protein [Planctomycetes bacterium]|nr:adenylyltransferase/cytidyltransferase family protein [Planctomycetota bacterium]